MEQIKQFDKGNTADTKLNEAQKLNSFEKESECTSEGPLRTHTLVTQYDQVLLIAEAAIFSQTDTSLQLFVLE